MRCQFCNKEFSQPVMKFHKKRCPKNPANKVEKLSRKEQLLAEAKKLGLDIADSTTIKELEAVIKEAKKQEAK